MGLFLRDLNSNLALEFVHCLKWRYSPKMSNDWLGLINNDRVDTLVVN